MTTIQELQNKVVQLSAELDATHDNLREDIIYAELREVNRLLDTSLHMGINDKIKVQLSDIVSLEPNVEIHHGDGRKTYSKTSFLVKLVPESVLTDRVGDPCGQCEECWTNGMPEWCTSRVMVTAYYYQQIQDTRRIWGDPTDGFYLRVIKSL